MSDIGPYGTNQNAGREGPVTANQLVGERVGLTTGDGIAVGVSPALHSTAPYRPSQRKAPLPPVPPDAPRGARGCCGNDGSCGAPRMRDTDYCVFHSPGYLKGKARREPSRAS